MKFWSMVLAAILGLAALLYRVATIAQEHNVSFDTYISIVLSALAVMLTALAIIVGIAAVWGYQQISEQAELRAEAAVGTKLESLLSNPSIHAKLLSIVDARITQEGDTLFADWNLTGAGPAPRVQNETEEEQSIAALHPESGGQQ